jgi:hypothetical protein
MHIAELACGTIAPTLYHRVTPATSFEHPINDPTIFSQGTSSMARESTHHFQFKLEVLTSITGALGMLYRIPSSRKHVLDFTTPRWVMMKIPDHLWQPIVI